jgi:hypothetical protein
MGSIMRIALTTALMMVTALAFAGGPSAPETKSEQAAEAAADKQGAQPPATDPAAKVAEEDAKPFKPPAGYKPKRINGELVYCTKTVILGSKFPVVDCRNEAQLREMARTNRGMRDDLNRGRACAGGDCSAR